MAAELAGRAVFPAVEADVDFEHDDRGQEHDAQNDLHPLVKLVAAAILDLVNAPGQHEHDREHGQKQQIEHERSPECRESRSMTGIVGLSHEATIAEAFNGRNSGQMRCGA